MRLAAIPIAAALALAWPLVSAALPASGAFHLRPKGAEARDLIDTAASRSETIGRQVEALSRSDVVVFVDRSMGQGQWRRGHLRFMVTAGGIRYLYVWIEQWARLDDQIAMLAHELQHALEVASATWVVDCETMRSLYAQIGIRLDGGQCWETDAAISVERSVRREINGTLGAA